MCWRPIGGKVARVQGPAGPLASALPPRVARTMPTMAAATIIATPMATNQRFSRRGPPDSTRRCGPAVLCCGPWLVRGGGGRQRFEEAPPVGARAQAGVENRDDALVPVAADEAPEALAELEDRRGEGVLGEPVSTLLRDPLAARLD